MNDSSLQLLFVSGSLRSESLNTQLLRVAESYAKSHDDVSVSFASGMGEIEPFNVDHEQTPSDAVQHWWRAIRAADAVLISTPEYNGSIPGQLKNSLDWASRSDGEKSGKEYSPLYGVPVATMSASPGQYGAVWAKEDLQRVLKTQGARVIEDPSFSLAKARTALEHNSLDGERNNAVISSIIDELVSQARAVKKALAAVN